MRDLNQSDELNLTQEFLAQMLGVQRSSVSVVAGTLQKAGFIKYRRGKIQMVDVEAIRSGACECYGKIRQNYEKLLS
jgi:Mn-dependent DtxR family transcriptional regulator